MREVCADRLLLQSAFAPRRAAALLAGLLLSSLAPSPALAEKAARAAVCENPSDRGYADGLNGAKAAKAALKACPKQSPTYQSAYRAGAYVRSLDRSFGGGGGRQTHRPAAGTGGASSGAFERDQPLSAGTLRTLNRSRCGAANGQASGAAGAPYPQGCAPGAATARGFARGQALRRAQAQAAQSAMERSRLNTRLLSPSLSAGERRMIQNRLRSLNQQDGLRRIQDPYLR